MMRVRRFFIILGCLLLVAFSLVSLAYMTYLRRPLIPATGEPLLLVFDKHASAKTLASYLYNKELIHFKAPFLAYTVLKGVSSQLKAGVYRIEPADTIPKLIERIVSGQTLIETLTIVEGTTLNQLKVNLAQAPFLSYQDQDWNVIPSHYPSLEGLFLADTYHYKALSSAKPLLELAHQHLEEALKESWDNRESDLPFHTPYELLIAASIVEKETALPLEKKLVASVLVNRLKRKMPLQMDPTVIYGLGSQYLGKLKHADLQVESLYNTYKRRGLPPTPIAMVGKQSLEAAAHPATSKYLYFVAKGDGSHEFSETYEQQKKAVFEYQLKGKS